MEITMSGHGMQFFDVNLALAEDFVRDGYQSGRISRV